MEIGAGEEQIQLALAAREPDAEVEAFELWEENLEVVGLYLALQTQWRVAVGFGSCAYLGLDYACVEALMRMRGLKNRPRLIEDLMVMEYAALPIRNSTDDG